MQKTLIRFLGWEEGIGYPLQCSWAFLVAHLVKNPQIWVQSLGGKIPWRRERLPTPVFWPGEFDGLYSPWGCKELDKTEQLSLTYRKLYYPFLWCFYLVLNMLMTKFSPFSPSKSLWLLICIFKGVCISCYSRTDYTIDTWCADARKGRWCPAWENPQTSLCWTLVPMSLAA